MIRITKSEARKLFADGKEIILVPNLLRPGAPWNPECRIDSARYLEDVVPWCEPWDRMYKNWAYYNLGDGMGRYAHYYKADRPAQADKVGEA